MYYEIFESLCSAKGVKPIDVSRATGISTATLTSWKKGKYTPKSDKLSLIADYFNVSLEYMTGNAERQTVSAPTVKGIPHRHLIPVLGRVAAGIPIEAEQEILDWEEISDKLATSGEFFALKVKGDSMEPKFSNGDVLIVRRQDYAEDGDYVIAIVNGSEGVCKRLKKYDGGIALVSLNPAYPPMYFSVAEIESIPVHIIGLVKELRAKF